MKIFIWLLDMGYSIGAKFLGIINKEAPASYLKGGRTNVHAVELVLIPGIGEQWGMFKPMMDFLNSKGYIVHVIPELGYNMQSVPVAAQMVADTIDKQKIKNTILVSHSKGSLIGKYLMAHNDLIYIRGMVVLAGVFKGTPWVKISPLPAHREMHPASKIINQLGNKMEINKKIISIFPEWDHYLSSTKSSYLEGALANVELKMRGHVRIVYTKQVWEEILRAIEKLELYP